MLHRDATVARVLLVVASVLLMPAGWARGQCGPQWLPGEGVGGITGTANALATWDADGAGPQAPVLAVGGAIGAAGSVFVDDVGIWDGVSWRATAEAGTCNALLAVGSELYGGGFGPAPGVWVSRWTGAAWQQLSSPLGSSGVIHAMAEFGGRVIAAGQVTLLELPATFRQVNIVQRVNNTWESLGSGVNGIVWALAVYNGELIAAGEFSQAGGVAAANIARWNGTAWQALGSGLVGTRVRTLAVHENQLVAGGLFTQAGGVTVQNVARWDGVSWSGMGTALNNQVESLAVHNGELFAGGSFTGSGGFQSPNVFRWNGSAFVPLATGMDGGVTRLASHRGKLVASGLFTTAGGTPASNIASWDGSGWSGLGAGASANGLGAWQMTAYQGSTFVGGAFAALSSTAANSVALFDGAGFSALGSGLERQVPWGRLPGSVLAATEWNGGLVVAGGFVRAGGVDVTDGQARWNGSAWSRLTTPGTLTGSPAALGVFNSQLVGAGIWYDSAFRGTSRVMTFSNGLWSPLGGVFASALGLPQFSRLAVFNGELIVAGTFDSVAGQTVNNIARWDGSAWRPLGTGITGQAFLTNVGGLAVYNGELIATGSFTGAGGVAVQNIARWDGSAWRSLGAGVRAFSPATAVYRGSLVAYVSLNQGPMTLARWNGSVWTPFGGALDGLPFAMSVAGEELRIAGSFTRVGGRVSAYFARWTDTGAPLAASGPASASIAPGATLQLSAAPAAGYSGVSVQWLRNGVAISNGAGGASPGGGVVSGASGVLASPTTGEPVVLTISGVAIGDAGEYTARFTNACGSATTAAAVVVVSGGCPGSGAGACGPGDWNEDGAIDFNDLLAFLNDFTGQSACSDITGDGVTDFNDLLEFLNRFNAGC